VHRDDLLGAEIVRGGLPSKPLTFTNDDAKYRLGLR